MIAVRSLAPVVPSGIAAAVTRGLTARQKHLPATLFYDEAGSLLFEQITELPEYYLTRTERAIFERQGEAIVRSASEGGQHPLNVVELGAGTAEKSQILLSKVVELQGATEFYPVDVSPAALQIAEERLQRAVPDVRVTPLVMTHEQALGPIRRVPARQLVLFIGSSIGNYDEPDGVSLLRGVRSALAPDARLLLGTDVRKDSDTLIRAYNDSQGVTAHFNLNVLARINRELGGHFVVDRFRHVVVYNEEHSRIEMHLESQVDQMVHIDALDLDVPFKRAERIHTESSYKYDWARVTRLLHRSGFQLDHTFADPAGSFWVHLARAA
jgi:dimethylhistidine N-methyltransferase